MPPKTTPENIEERFWSRVTVGGPNECWIWNGATTGHPRIAYGRFRYYGKTTMAHHVPLLLEGEEITGDTRVLHRCDNPLCVNPAHLFLGTQADNIQDMIEKGRDNRSRKGEENPSVKLAYPQVLEIRDLYDRGLSQQEIADMFSVNQTTVSRITRRVIWSHLK